jgi:hypothetical protein
VGELLDLIDEAARGRPVSRVVAPVGVYEAAIRGQDKVSAEL